MKIKYNLLFAAGILIALSLGQFSCSSSKKSAVSCPDFSHSRNMKSRHAQFGSAHQDNLAVSHSSSAWARQSWFRGASAASQEKNLNSRMNIAPGYRQINTKNFPGRISSAYTLPARVQLAGSVISPVCRQKSASATAIYMPAITKFIETASSGCDTIVLRNGDVMMAKVLEIGRGVIRYRKCGDNEGPVFVVNINEVFMIKYPTGTRDYFTSERNPTPSTGDTVAKKTDGLAVAGFIGSLVGLFIAGIPLGIMAIVFGFVSIGKINRHNDRYRGKGFAIASILIGAIDVIGMLIILGNM